MRTYPTVGGISVLSTHDLVTNAKRAIAEGRLGIQRGAVEPLFVGEDGSVCAIAAGLPHDVLQAIRRNGHSRCAWLDLVRGGYFGYDNLGTVEALSTLQLGYDACFCDGGFDDGKAKRFCVRLMSLDAPTAGTVSWSEFFGMDHAT